jgi:hypothetical protein
MSGRNRNYGSWIGSLDQRIQVLAREYAELARLRDRVRQAEARRKKLRRSAGRSADQEDSH